MIIARNSGGKLASPYLIMLNAEMLTPIQFCWIVWTQLLSTELGFCLIWRMEMAVPANVLCEVEAEVVE
jgi:hypothetical protein